MAIPLHNKLWSILAKRFMKKIALIIMMLFLLSQALALDLNYQVTNLPYTNQTNVTVQGIINQTWTIACLANCTLTFPSKNNITFNNTNETVTFNISIPSDYTNQSITIAEFYSILDQNNTLNQSLTFIFNISLPPPNNITITSTNPINGAVFGLNDIIPSSVIINYSGIINYNKSNIILYYNNTIVPWITFIHDNQSFTFTLTEFYDGKYIGNWTLTDQNNQSANYNYTMTIQRNKPPRPIQITPDKGSYTTETITLQATMDNSDYALSYIIHDGLPDPNDPNWISMSPNQQVYTANINMNSQPVGQTYIKIIDIVGNQAIYNTGIISTTTTSLDIFRRIREVQSDTDITLDMTYTSKSGTGTLLRCKMDDFTSTQGGNRTNTWPTQGHTYITFNSQDYNLKNNYDTVINIGSTSQTMELNLNIPSSAILNYEYSTSIYCFLTP